MSIDRLAAKIAAAPVNARGHRRYSATLKREIMASLAASGMTHRDFAARVGLPEANLCHWRELPVISETALPAPKFKEIAIEPDVAVPTFSLRAPGGIVFEGLTAAAAAELIAAVSARSSC